MRLTWLADVLRAAGARVVEVPGWQQRGRDLSNVEGIVYHATVTGPGNDNATAALLRDGRADLAGPLAQLGLSREGVWYVVAAGKANHNGYGAWGNQSIGVEEFNWNGFQGRNEPFNEREAARGIAAILKHLGLGSDRVRGHKETDPRRKSDPNLVNMPAFRAKVAALIAGHEEDDMPSIDELRQLQKENQAWLKAEHDRIIADYADRLASINGNVKDIEALLDAAP